MLKRLVVLSTAAALVGSAALADQRSEVRDQSYFDRPSLEDLGAFTDARVAALHAGLRLTPEQEKNWPAFEQAYRNLAKLRADRMAANRQDAGEQNLVDRLQRRADGITQYGAALQDLAKASRPLFQSLDEAQKRRFAALSRFMAPRHYAMGMRHGMGGHHGPRGGPGGGPGFGADQ
jgi:zinc resistance-associated protein